MRGLVITLIVLVLAALTVRAVWGYVAARQLRAEIAKIRAANQPLTFDDLDAQAPKVDPADNAARFYMAAMELVLSFDRQVLEKIKQQEPDKQVIEQAHQILTSNHQALELLDQGAVMAACQADLGVRRGIGPALNHLGAPRLAARLLSLRTHHLILQGKTQEASDSLISTFKLLRLFEREPVLIVYLVRASILTLGCGDIAAVLERADLDDATLTQLQEVLLLADKPEFFARCILGERVMGMLLMRLVIADDTGVSWPKDTPVELSRSFPVHSWSRPMARQLAIGYLRDMEKLVKASHPPWPQVFDAMNKIEANSLLGGILTPSIQNAARTAGRVTATARSARVAVMIERYRLANGKPPTALGQLVPTYTDALPADPFTGQDLICRSDEQGYTVYSLGDDKIDHGGNVIGKEKPTTDWGVHVRIRADR